MDLISTDDGSQVAIVADQSGEVRFRICRPCRLSACRSQFVGEVEEDYQSAGPYMGTTRCEMGSA